MIQKDKEVDIMGTVDYEFVENKLHSICEEYSDILGLVILFGSFSRREASEWSDIDLYIEPVSSEMTTSKLWNNKRYKEFQYNLFESFPQEFDLLAYGGKRDVDNIKKSPIWKQIVRDGVTIYDQRAKAV